MSNISKTNPNFDISFHRKAYGKDQCDCSEGFENCLCSNDYTWFATCSGEVIHGMVFAGENVENENDGKFEMKSSSDLTGLVNAEKMILKVDSKYINSQYQLHKM